MKYDAITFDTQTIVSKGFNFDKGLLSQLRQFSIGPTEVIVSEIVMRELLNHLIEDTREVRDKLVKATKTAAEFGLIKNVTPNYVNDNSDPAYIAKRRLDRFFREIGATVVSVDAVSAKQLINLYFESAPPFARGKKKNEFPDAIALLSIQEWAYKNDKCVIAVSGDSDWAAFGAKSDRIDVVADLAEGLAVLQKNVHAANAVLCRVLHAIVADGAAEEPCGLWDEFYSNIAEQIAQKTVEATADSEYQTEVNDVYLELENVGFEGVPAGNLDVYLEHERPPGPPYAFDFTVVQGGANKISAEVSIKLLVAVNASVSFFVHDEISKEKSNVGSVRARKLIDEFAVILLTIEGEFDLEKEIMLADIEIIEFPKSFHLGQVEPDSREKYYDDESPEDPHSSSNKDSDEGQSL